MAKNTGEVSQTQRLNYIRSALSQAGEVSIRRLAQHFKVSEMTIRRDLALLESKGEVIRIHGGAASAQRVTFEFRFRDKQRKNLPQKQAIANAALEHIHDGDTIILDTGTTTLEIARLLAGRYKLTIITTSLAIVSQLQFDDEIQIILLGGFLRDGAPDLHGPLTEQNLDMFKADTAFIGGDAVDKKGIVYTNDLRLLNFDRKMASISDKLIVVADSSKFQAKALCKAFDPNDYERIITDEQIDPATKKELTKNHINVEIAPILDK
ncbi:MAG: DeoR/GlpR transcriptional regulator [Sedimentisphaerales bacterium]|nr:DeoR/GlpR transcriptional regulator [Sedimentisphaerales bacterium]